MENILSGCTRRDKEKVECEEDVKPKPTVTIETDHDTDSEADHEKMKKGLSIPEMNALKVLENESTLRNNGHEEENKDMGDRLAERRKMITCRFWKKYGDCKFEEECRYNHPQTNRNKNRNKNGTKNPKRSSDRNELKSSNINTSETKKKPRTCREWERTRKY